MLDLSPIENHKCVNCPHCENSVLDVKNQTLTVICNKCDCKDRKSTGIWIEDIPSTTPTIMPFDSNTVCVTYYEKDNSV